LPISRCLQKLLIGTFFFGRLKGYFGFFLPFSGIV
jgi:hypothetical protein